MRLLALLLATALALLSFAQPARAFVCIGLFHAVFESLSKAEVNRLKAASEELQVQVSAARKALEAKTNQSALMNLRYLPESGRSSLLTAFGEDLAQKDLKYADAKFENPAFQNLIARFAPELDVEVQTLRRRAKVAGNWTPQEELLAQIDALKKRQIEVLRRLESDPKQSAELNSIERRIVSLEDQSHEWMRAKHREEGRISDEWRAWVAKFVALLKQHPTEAESAVLAYGNRQVISDVEFRRQSIELQSEIDAAVRALGALQAKWFKSLEEVQQKERELEQRIKNAKAAAALGAAGYGAYRVNREKADP